MSQRIEASITCPNCGHIFPFSLYRSIWGEDEQNKELVLSDRINVAACPSCLSKTKIEYPFLYVDVRKQFAVWWEPEYDPQIDKDSMAYAKMFGEGNYYQKAPRVKNWDEFKKVVKQYYSEELKANPIKLSQNQMDEFSGRLSNMIKDLEKKNKKNSGCLSSVILLLVVFGISLYETIICFY